MNKKSNRITEADEKIIESVPIDLDLHLLINKMDLNLDLAGIFFIAAWEHMEEGKKAFDKLEGKKQNYNKLLGKINKLRQSVVNISQVKNKKTKLVNKLEVLILQLISNLRKLELYYEPVTKHFSLARV
jgi:hypothetical protein